MNQRQKNIFSSFIFAAVISCSLLPALSPRVSALTMPSNGNELLDDSGGANAQAYIVINTENGNVLMNKNSTEVWPPASLTKLVTALVVMDTKPKLSKVISMSDADQTIGYCNAGGGCIKSKPGIKFTVNDLFYATLLPSANNAAVALARSTGMTPAQFAIKMNAKVKALGATNSIFHEPTGMDATNQITAADYAKIIQATYANTYLKKVAQTQIYTIKSLTNKKYTQTVKNSDKLLSTSSIKMLGAKTGYINESQYNFASLLKYENGPTLAVVVLGEPHLYTAFSDTQRLAGLAGAAIAISKPLN